MAASDESYVRLDKADFQFCAAHFCVFPGEREPLHGHNYRVYLELGGPVDDLGYVAEFGWLKSVVRQLVATLDHRVILAERCPELRVARESEQVRVFWREDSWSFPNGDVVCLPVKNTTAELLAGYLWEQVRTKLPQDTGWQRLTVEVEETPGQRAGITRELGGAAR
ncbi:MAG TPA: 6-carboxytetrahydropterin synthase [Chloroflexota bacterium]|nr:6-carboxytetrahydropterin synthase [Chloroflexota bacterium]